MKNTLSYVALAVLVAVAVADDEPKRSKKEAAYNALPYGQTTDANKYLATSAAGYNYFNQQPYYPSGYQPYNGQYNPQYNQQYYQHNQQQLPYQRYNNYNNYPYNNNNQYYQQYSQQPYGNQYNPYVNQYNPYAGYQNGYQTGYGLQQTGYGFQNSLGYNPLAVRQAPVYPSPGFQPVHAPAPHPFYHTAGTYYPPQTTEANKPTTVVAVDPKKTY